MINMKPILLTVAILSSALGLSQHPGGGKYVPTAEEKALFQQLRQLEVASDELYSEGKFTEALAKLNETIPLYKPLKLASDTGFFQRRARIYVSLGQLDDARQAFREGFVYGEGPTLSATGHLNGVRFQTAYAKFLSSTGDHDAAQMIFYNDMLGHALSAEFKAGPSAPALLLTFQPDAKGDYWEYSPARLEAAMLVQHQLVNLAKYNPDLLPKAMELFPEWYYPYLLKACVTDEILPVSERMATLNEAQSRARTDQERVWIGQVRTILELDKEQQAKELAKFASAWQAVLAVETYQQKRAALAETWSQFGIQDSWLVVSGTDE